MQMHGATKLMDDCADDETVITKKRTDDREMEDITYVFADYGHLGDVYVPTYRKRNLAKELAVGAAPLGLFLRLLAAVLDEADEDDGAHL